MRTLIVVETEWNPVTENHPSNMTKQELLEHIVGSAVSDGNEFAKKAFQEGYVAAGLSSIEMFKHLSHNVQIAVQHAFARGADALFDKRYGVRGFK